MKKISFLLVLLCMAYSSYGYVTINGINYDLNTSDLTASVYEQGISKSGNVVIPSTIQYQSQTYTVTSIGDNAFYECAGLTSVTIPNSVTSIGYRAFYECAGLTSVTISNSVTSIGDGAFFGCSGLTSMTIPNSVTSIGSGAFYDCSGLTSMTIPNSVTSIGVYAFYNCTGLTSVTIPSGVTSIGSYTFSRCRGLTSVTIPNGVTSIGDNAFSVCSGLTSVTISNSVTSIGAFAFHGCSGLTSLTIPNGVTSIGADAFELCTGLTSVTIPNSVTSIGHWAFNHIPLTQLYFNADCCNCNSAAFSQNNITTIIIGDSVRCLTGVQFPCNNTTDITCNAIVPPACNPSTFSNYSATLHVPYASMSAYQNAPIWGNFHIEGTGAAYNINAHANNTTMGSVEGTGTYGENQIATLKAIPNMGYAFNGWSDGDTNNPRNVTVTQDSTFTAVFATGTSDTIHVTDTLLLTDTIYQIDTLYITEYETDTIYLEYDGINANQYSLEDYGVYYFMNMVVNRDGLYLKLYAMDGKLLNKGTGNFDLTYYANGIYIVTDGKGGFLKINHFKQ